MKFKNKAIWSFYLFIFFKFIPPMKYVILFCKIIVQNVKSCQIILNLKKSFLFLNLNIFFFGKYLLGFGLQMLIVLLNYPNMFCFSYILGFSPIVYFLAISFSLVIVHTHGWNYFSPYPILVLMFVRKERFQKILNLILYKLFNLKKKKILTALFLFI